MIDEPLREGIWSGVMLVLHTAISFKTFLLNIKKAAWIFLLFTYRDAFFQLDNNCRNLNDLSITHHHRHDAVNTKMSFLLLTFT